MLKKPVRFFGLVLLVGWCFDFLFWGHPLGVNYAFFMTIVMTVGIYLLKTNNIQPAKKTLLLLVPYFFFSIVTFVRREPITVSLAYTFSLLSASLFASSYLGGRWINYNLADYFARTLRLLFSMGAQIPQIISENKEEVSQLKTRANLKTLKPVLRGVLIAVPILLILAALLSSADMVFSTKLKDALDIFSLEDGFNKLLRLFIILSVAYLVSGAYLHAGIKSTDENLVGVERPILKPKLGFTETTIVLGNVIVLFLFFVIIQFQYFFGGEENIGIEGFSYSEYARKGFSELLIVAFISLMLVIGFRLITNLNSLARKRFYSVFSIVMVSEVMVILASSYQRLMLAIGWHSYSRLRVYPRVFIPWLAILFITVVILGMFEKERYYTFSALLASFGFALTLFVMNVDASIIHFNVGRVSEGGRLSVHYFSTLTMDAVPALVMEFQNPDSTEEIREAMGASIMCFLYDHDPELRRDQEWRSFNFSLWRAKSALAELEPDTFDEYPDTEIFGIEMIKSSLPVVKYINASIDFEEF